MTDVLLPLKTVFRKRRPDENEEDNHPPPHSKRTKQDRALLDPRAVEVGTMAT